jgi:hypothetical protein
MNYWCLKCDPWINLVGRIRCEKTICITHVHRTIPRASLTAIIRNLCSVTQLFPQKCGNGIDLALCKKPEGLAVNEMAPGKSSAEWVHIWMVGQGGGMYLLARDWAGKAMVVLSFAALFGGSEWVAVSYKHSPHRPDLKQSGTYQPPRPTI